VVIAHKTRWGLVNGGVQFAMHHAQRAFDVVSSTLAGFVNSLTAALMRIPALLLISIYHRRLRAASTLGLALFILGDAPHRQSGVLGATNPDALAVVFATVVCIHSRTHRHAAAHRPWLYRMLHPVLDLMQTIPRLYISFHPGIFLDSAGAGLISTVIFRDPRAHPLDAFGIASVPNQLLDVERRSRHSSQLLFKWSCAPLPTIMEGITQCIMLSSPWW